MPVSGAITKAQKAVDSALKAAKKDLVSDLRDLIKQSSAGFSVMPGAEYSLKPAFTAFARAASDALHATLQDNVRSVQKAATKQTYDKYADLVSDPVKVDIAAIAAESFDSFDDYLDGQVDDYADNVLDDLSERLADFSDMGLDEDADAADSLADIMTEKASWRGGLVLATVIVSAFCGAASDTIRDVAEDDGRVGRQWVARDEMCEDCNELDAEIVGPNEPFSDGSDGPPFHPNCRCTIEPAIDA